MHAGAISNLLTNVELDGCMVFEVGLDLLKESIIIKNNNVSIDCLDIDKEAVEGGNSAAIRLGLSDSLSYKHENILDTNYLMADKYDLALLCQMDYIFDDAELMKLASIFFDANIKNIILLTPSAYQFCKSPTKLMEAARNILASIRRRKHRDATVTYRRNIEFLTSLFSPFYVVKSKQDYSYPSGRMFLVHLQKN